MLTAVLGLARPGRGETVRVGLLFGPSAPSKVVLSGPGRFAAERASGAFDSDLKVQAMQAGLVVDHNSAGLWLEAEPAGLDICLKLDGRPYRGRLRVEWQSDGQLKVVNVLEIEDYLRGVVPNEMFAELEAFRVQAIISRTLALYVRDRGHRHEGDGFDLCTEGHCQVYRGAASETQLSDQAVGTTRGEVITRDGKVILAAYHSNAGGATDGVGEVWPGSIERDFTYLAAAPSPFDNAATKLNGYGWCYQWREQLRLDELSQRLREHGREVGAVRDLVVRARSRSGRVTELEIVGTRGRTRIAGAARVREALGTPSAKLYLTRTRTGFAAVGSGYGDGVGLSQHGALGMAWAGFAYDEILGHYYRGVELTEGYGQGRSRPLREPPSHRERRLAKQSG
jgi:stage II sporulation protein D